ncbi:hypothetical protein E2C01_020805 [Portunus trituberculatus]|uniref:Uncharacterized protein n=1 Tax=Portunus trituberculatus TaxID=210409 RepID=A0A5B7E165_PORTR|nr:hypothetical protein [Portunus trituberculatus]
MKDRESSGREDLYHHHHHHNLPSSFSNSVRKGAHHRISNRGKPAKCNILKDKEKTHLISSSLKDYKS